MQTLKKFKPWMLLAFSPVVFIIFAVLHFSVHAPFWDQWEMVPMFQHHDAGTLSFNDFWMQHNEHRILFPNIVLYVLAQITHWDPYYEVVISLIFALATTALVVLMLRLTFSGRKYTLPILTILATWLVLSPIQSDNWIWGWQAEWFMSVLGVVGAIFFLTKPKLGTKTLIAAAIAATLATYSLGNGSVVWILGFILLLLLKTTWKQRAIWAGLGTVEIALYYFNFVNPPYEPSKGLFLHEPFNFARYVFIYLGRPLAFDFHVAQPIGIALVMIFATCVGYLWKTKRAEFKKLLPWFGLGLYGLAGATITAISRMGFGLEQAYSARYTTISLFFTLSTVVFAVVTWQEYFKNFKKLRQVKLLSAAAACGLFIPLLLISYYKGYLQMQELNSHLVEVRQCLQTAKSIDAPCLPLAYPNAEVAWERLQYLRDKGWGGF
jgi:uncharacterized membrane protein